MSRPQVNKPQVVGQPSTSKQFQTGINTIADLLAPTLGPTGGHVASQRTSSSNPIELIDDAATIVRRILSFGTQQKDIGAMLMRNLVWRMSQESGDGGATTAVLARAFYNEGLKLVAAGANSVQLERSLKHGIAIAVDAIRAHSIPVRDEDTLASVARTITKEDDLSAVLGEMSYLLGPDASVIIEKYVAPYLSREYIAGANYKAEILSMYFYSDVQRKRTVLTNSAVALVNDRVIDAALLIPVLQAAISAGHKSLLVIAKDISGDALNLLVSNHQLKEEAKKIDILAVKLGVIGDLMRWSWTDIETITGATILGSEGIKSPSQTTSDDLGQIQRVEFANKSISIVINKEARAAMQAKVLELRSYLSTIKLDDDERPNLIARLATFTGGIGRLKVGADSKVHREILYKQSERAFNVLSSAQRNGVVVGGGGAYVHAAAAVRAAIASNGVSGEALMGLQLIERVLSIPMKQIVKNAATDVPAVIVDRVATAGAPMTYDALSGSIVDAFDSGILDITDVVVAALQIASSGAMMALSTDVIIYHRNPEQSLTP